MKFILSRLFIFSLLTTCLLACVQQDSGYAPKTIGGKSINFYTEQSTVSCDQSILKQPLRYDFHKDGSYKSFLKNRIWENGDFSYHKTKPNHAQVTMSYNPDDSKVKFSQTDTYAFNMYFTSSDSGTWEISYLNIDHELQKESGTFKIIN